MLFPLLEAENIPPNHRFAEVGTDLWRSPDPNPLLKQGHLDQVAQHLVYLSFDYLQGRELYNLSSVQSHFQKTRVLSYGLSYG